MANTHLSLSVLSRAVRYKAVTPSHPCGMKLHMWLPAVAASRWRKKAREGRDFSVRAERPRVSEVAELAPVNVSSGPSQFNFEELMRVSRDAEAAGCPACKPRRRYSAAAYRTGMTGSCAGGLRACKYPTTRDILYSQYDRLLAV